MITNDAKESIKTDIIQVYLIGIEQSGIGKFNISVDNIPPIITSKFILNHEVGLINKKKSNLSASQRNKVLALYKELERQEKL